MISQLDGLRERIDWARRNPNDPRGAAVAVRLGERPLAFGYFDLRRDPPLLTLGRHIAYEKPLEWRLYVEGPHHDLYFNRERIGVRFGDLDRQQCEGIAFPVGCAMTELHAVNISTWITFIGDGPLTWHSDTPDQ